MPCSFDFVPGSLFPRIYIVCPQTRLPYLRALPYLPEEEEEKKNKKKEKSTKLQIEIHSHAITVANTSLELYCVVVHNPSILLFVLPTGQRHRSPFRVAQKSFEHSNNSDHDSPHLFPSASFVPELGPNPFRDLPSKFNFSLPSTTSSMPV